MAVLLPTVTVAVWSPSLGDDGHGWGEAYGWSLLATVTGSVQAAPSPSGVDAAGDGGGGPLDPAPRRAADVWLPEGTGVDLGCVLDDGDRRWLVRSVDPAPDPTGGGAGAEVAGCVEWTGDVPGVGS